MGHKISWMQSCKAVFICLFVFLAHCLLAHGLPAPAHPYVLMHYTADEAGREPMRDIPYSVTRNGQSAGLGKTNAWGEVSTTLHRPGVQEDWIVRLALRDDGTEEVFGIRVMADGTSKKVFDERADNDRSEQPPYVHNRSSCNANQECLDKPSLWFASLGRSASSEPYAMFSQDKLVASGLANENGIIFIKTAGMDLSKPMQLLFCDQKPLDISIQSIQDSAFEIANGEAVSDQAKSVMAKLCIGYHARPFARIADFNQGRPILHAGLNYGELQADLIAKSKAEEDAKEARDKAEVAAYKEGKTHIYQGGLPSHGHCPEDMLGTFGVGGNPASQSFIGAAKQFLNPAYEVGKPAFRISRQGDKYVWTGLVSGLTKDIEITSEENFACIIKLDHDDQMLMFDYSRLTDDQMKKFTEDFSPPSFPFVPDPDDLRKVPYFFVWSFSMTGVTGGVFFLPLVRMSVP